jgi:hypothetical protein
MTLYRLGASFSVLLVDIDFDQQCAGSGDHKASALRATLPWKTSPGVSDIVTVEGSPSSRPN